MSEKVYHAAHKIQLLPNQQQEVYLNKCAGSARFVWNWALNAWQKEYEDYKIQKEITPDIKPPNARALRTYFNKIKDEQFPWIREVYGNVGTEVFRHLDTAFKNFFKHQSKYPRFKKRGQHDSFTLAAPVYDDNGNKRCGEYSVHDRKIRVQLPRGEKSFSPYIRMRESLRYEGKLLSATISKTADKWYVSIGVELAEPPYCKTLNLDNIGLDCGISHLATLSNGMVFDSPKPLSKYERLLARRQRQLAKKQKGSNNKNKAKLKVAKIYNKITNIRANCQHQISAHIAKTYTSVVVEDLNVSGMQKNRHLSKAISDVGMSGLLSKIEYKGDWSGTHVIKASRWFASSQICSVCGASRKLKLSDRIYKCDCGLEIDRDLNAAINLKNLGMNLPEVTPAEIALAEEPLAQANC
jgi:putative transposase